MLGDIEYRKKDIEKYFANEIEYQSSLEHQSNKKILRALKFFVHRAEYIMEAACLLIGWIFIWRWPGIASLRLFRVLLILWY